MAHTYHTYIIGRQHSRQFCSLAKEAICQRQQSIRPTPLTSPQSSQGTGANQAVFSGFWNRCRNTIPNITCRKLHSGPWRRSWAPLVARLFRSDILFIFQLETAGQAFDRRMPGNGMPHERLAHLAQ